MTNEEFDNILNERIDALKRTLAVKGKEYAFGDRLSNFKRGSEITYSTPSQVCWMFMLKHFVSLQDMIETPETDFPICVWEEKIGDMINYLILLEAIIKEGK